MAEFLSTAWMRELHEIARAHQRLAEQTRGLNLVVEQRIDGDHAHPPDGAVAVAAGPAATPTVTFAQDRPTARAIATGEASAQRAFMTGGLRVGGDLQALLAAQEVLVGLGDVFAAVRETTDFGDA